MSHTSAAWVLLGQEKRHWFRKSRFYYGRGNSVFADVIAAWVVDCWQKMGTPRVIHLVEIGPGRGTLMRNMLKQIKFSTPQLFHFLNVHLVEVGAARTEEQKKALTEFQTANQKIKWWLNLDSIPFQVEPTIFVCNEYFDALPIAEFRYTSVGGARRALRWTTIRVRKRTLSFVHAPSGSFTAYLIPEDVRKNAKIGDVIEINAFGMQAMENLMKKMIDCKKAAALIIDYGKDEHMKSTLRGIRGHKFVDPLLSPGDIDLSAWVSLSQLGGRWSVWKSPSAISNGFGHDPKEFLEWGGIDVRLAHVIKEEETKGAMRILQSYRRLTDPEEMGRRTKYLRCRQETFPMCRLSLQSMCRRRCRMRRHKKKTFGVLVVYLVREGALGFPEGVRTTGFCV